MQNKWDKDKAFKINYVNNTPSTPEIDDADLTDFALAFIKVKKRILEKEDSVSDVIEKNEDVR